MPECGENLSYVKWRNDAQLAAIAGEKMIAVNRRVREVQLHPEGFSLANNATVTAGVPLPENYILPSDLVVPKKEEATLRKLEKEMREKAAALDPEITLISGVCGDPSGAEATLLSKLSALKEKAFQFRQQLVGPHGIEHKEKRKKVLPLGVGSMTTTNAAAVLSGAVVRCSDGTYEGSDRIIARYQRHERIDRERRRQ